MCQSIATLNHLKNLILDSKGLVRCCCGLSFPNYDPAALRHRCLRVHLWGLPLEAKHGDPILGRLRGINWQVNKSCSSAVTTYFICKQGFKFHNLFHFQIFKTLLDLIDLTCINIFVAMILVLDRKVIKKLVHFFATMMFLQQEMNNITFHHE